MESLKKISGSSELEDKIQLYRERNITRSDVQNDRGPTLAELGKEDENRVYALIIKYIVELNEFLNIKTKMNREQIIETAVMIYSDYGKYRESDLKYFFGQVKRGHYGEMYEALDGSKIMQWLLKYDFTKNPRLAI